MAWNRPTAEAGRTEAKRERKSGRGFVKGLAAAVIVVGGAVAAWFVLSPSAPETPVRESRAPKAIKEVTPAPAPVATAEKKPKRNRRPKTQQKFTKSIGQLPNLPMVTNRPARVYGEINGKSLFPRPLFKTREENHIAGLVTAEPGSRCPLSGFHPGEEERYLAALDVPVEFEEIDTPQERETKELMIELKKELKDRVAEGEKITDIVQGLRNELNEMANMKDKIAQKFSLLQKEGTVEEIMQYYKEANEILAEYGMRPLALRSNKKEVYETYLERKKAQQEAAQQEPVQQEAAPTAAVSAENQSQAPVVE